MTSYFLLYVALGIALLDWIAVVKNWKRLEYFAKPGVMVVLLAWLWQATGFGGYLLWFALGVLLSLAGDVFLMLPREQFIAGLVSFLLAHIAYLIGFNMTLPALNLAGLIMAILVGLTARQVHRRIAAGLAASGNQGLQMPVLIYSIVISLMLLSALLTLTRPETSWLAWPALLASAGALLFFLSDTFLAWNKFVVRLPHGKLQVIVTYHLGQALIVLGAATNYLFLSQ